MLNEKSIVISTRTEAAEGKTPKGPAYRAPRVIEVGKTSQLLQGYLYRTFRDGTPGYTSYYQ